VIDIRAVGAGDPSRVLAIAAAVEARSEHPLAGAIRSRAAADGLVLPAATDARALPGLGAEGWIGDARVLVGNERLFREEGDISPEAAGAIRDLERSGNTVVLVGLGEAPAASGSGAVPPEPRDDRIPMRIIGAIALADAVRAEAVATVRALRDAGLGHVALLTGDHAATADAVASRFGGAITEVRSGLLPADKVTAVRSLRARYGPVLMVGDGINDAPALAAADVGIAMGAAGTDVALETADIALMADDLTALPVMVRLARRAERIIRVNIAFALIVKAVFVVLAVGGVATLWMAVLADMGASLVVIANGMRALRAPESSIS
jgi:Cd2+/Zn2+-exporting ATPase